MASYRTIDQRVEAVQALALLDQQRHQLFPRWLHTAMDQQMVQITPTRVLVNTLSGVVKGPYTSWVVRTPGADLLLIRDQQFRRLYQNHAAIEGRTGAGLLG